MAKYAEELFTVTDSATKTYTFTKTYRSETTIKVYLRTPPGDFSETNLFTLSGSEGALDMTLISTAASGLQVGDIIKIAREEDLAKANRPVTFQAGSLSSVDLNDAMEHVLNGVQEISDTVADCIGAVSEIIEKGKKQGVFNGDDPMKLSWLLWSLFVGIGHLNEARTSLDVGKKGFESLFDFAYQTMISNSDNEPCCRPVSW